MSKHEQKMAAARAAAIFKAPYFASAIYGFVFHPIPGIRTMLCTPKMILGYDPAWAEEATIPELAADIVHEVNHFIRKHFERAQQVDDPALWNIAGDLAINPDLVEAGWKMADSAIFPHMYDLPANKTAEEYYQLLKKQQQQKQQEQEQQAAKSSSEQAPQTPVGGSGAPPPSPPPPNAKPPTQAASTPTPGDPKDAPSDAGAAPAPTAPKSPGIGHGRCGGMGGASDHPALEKELDAMADLGRSDAEVKGIKKRVAQDIKKHAEQKGRGSVPGDLLAQVEGFDSEVPVRWQDELAHIIRDATGRLQAGGDDFSMRRPSRRSFTRGFLRPGLIEHLPEVAIVRDTSGSMGAQQLMDATREAYNIMAALGIDEVWFVDADTRLAEPWKRVGAQFFKELREAKGRGGTDFRPAIEAAGKLTPAPNILIYVTDGDGTTTDMPPPDMAVVWCVIPSYYNKPPASWGHTVIVRDDKTRS